LKRLKEIYGVKIIVPSRGGFQVILERSTKMFSLARKDIEGNLSRKASFFDEKDYISQVIGDEGKNIQALEDTLDVFININRQNRQVVSKGTTGTIDAKEPRMQSKTKYRAK